MENDDVLDAAFPNPELELDTPLLDGLVVDQIPRSSYNLMEEEVDGVEKMRKELFGNDYTREYSFRRGKPYKKFNTNS